MRAPALGLLLALPVLAGCLGQPLDPAALAPGFDPAAVGAPGGTVERVAGGARALWEGLVPAAGLQVELGIPPGVTMVDAELSWPAGGPGLTMLPRESSPLRRCPRFEDLGAARLVCRGLTVLDPLPATWTFDLRPLGAIEAPVPFALQALLTSQPLDGSAARIRLDQLSTARHGALGTEVHLVPATSDGALLFVEATRPALDAPVPAILVSSPYNQAARVAGARPFEALIADYVPRGYAVVVADVRGFANSGGCVDVWGPREQQDQADLVAWVASQPWSDGKVAMYGQSYAGTTPHEAAVLGAPGLATIVTVAGLTDPYFDWHFGGVPNGEQLGSPLAYHRLGAEVPTHDEDRVHWAGLVAQSYCDAVPFLARANDPRAVYDRFYEERNLTARVGDVRVPVLYSQGFLDRNVKSSMALGWFNDLDVPKKGLFGPWLHRHPPRADQDLLFHAWFDQWLQGRDTGILDTPAVESLTLQGTWRAGVAWPPPSPAAWELHLDAPQSRLVEREAPPGEESWVQVPVRSWRDLNRLAEALGGPAVEDDGRLPLEAVQFELPVLAGRRYLSGAPVLDLDLSVRGAANTHVAAFLWERDGDERRLVTFGMRNAALREDYARYQPVPPETPVRVSVPFLPTEWVLEPARGLVLELRAAFPSDWELVTPGEPGVVTLHTGGGRGVLRLPVLDAPGDVPAPRTARVT